MTGEIEVYEGEAVEIQPANLFNTADPVAVVEQATRVADALKDVLRQRKLIKNIQGRDHVQVEGWTLLGSMLGVFPVLVWSRELADGRGFEARVEARTRSGEVVGAAEASCTRAEKTWSKRDEYALRSMAQTRATSKALRQPLGFIVVLAGYEAAPAEEMPDVSAGERSPRSRAADTRASDSPPTPASSAASEGEPAEPEGRAGAESKGRSSAPARSLPNCPACGGSRVTRKGRTFLCADCKQDWEVD